jgi:hypothetical protein
MLPAVLDRMKVRTIGILLLSVTICSVGLFGCIYNVRDIGFADLAPHPYRLFCFIQDATPQNVVTGLKQKSYTAFLDSNIKVEIINVDRDKNHPALEYFLFREIESFPAAILRSPTGRSLILPLSAPHESFDKTARFSFQNAISSPLREEILDRIVRAYCIVLLIEGKDEAENNRAHEVAVHTRRKIEKIMGQLPKRIEDPPLIIVIPLKKIPEERILLWSLGLDEERFGIPHIAVLYGRGRRIGPLLTGDKITGDRLYALLSLIGLSCDCGLDKKWMMGPLLPLRWDKKIQSDVVKFLGFDAENPMVKTEMSSIISLDLFKQAVDDKLRESLGDILDEYSEDIFEFEAESDSERVSPAKLRELTLYPTAQAKFGSRLKIILYVSGILVLLILGGGLLVLIRARRKLS